MGRAWNNYPKYRNRIVEYEGEKFDSQGELDRWLELKLLEKAGEIENLERQVYFELIPTIRDKDGKVIEKKCSYVADFVYTEKGEKVVEDKKGFRTEVYKLKRKLMLHKYGIRIRET